jgi:predicted SAM-dependent methyltransferase
MDHDKKIKLHLGCGNKFIPDFIHIDLIDMPHIDYNSDVSNLKMFGESSVDLIYASHVLEHFGRFEFRRILAEWFRVLKPDGILRLAVPDFAACAKIYYEQGLANGLNGLIGLISGGQKDQYDFHKMIFDEEFLTDELRKLGFRDIRPWDWRFTEHRDIDDYSQAYIPHMDKDNGMLMSLNLEAIK